MENVTLIFKKNFLQILQWSSLNVVIDNEETIKVGIEKPTNIRLSVGIHTIQMSFPYLGSECGVAQVQINIKENLEYELTYKPPLTVFTSGTILTKTFVKEETQNKVVQNKVVQNKVTYIYCKKCDAQLKEKTLVCTNCGSPTSYHNQNTRLNRNEDVVKGMTFLIGASATTLVSNLLYYSDMVTFNSGISMFLRFIQSMLIVIFCLLNVKEAASSKLFKGTVMTIGISSVLFQINTLVSYDGLIQFFLNNILKTIFLMGIVMLLVSTSEICKLSRLQNKVMIVGVVAIFTYTAWIWLINIFVIGKFKVTFEPLGWLFNQNKLILVIGSAVCLYISLIFYNTSKIED